MLYHIIYSTTDSKGWVALNLENGIDSVETLREVEGIIRETNNIRGTVIVTNWQPYDNQVEVKVGTDPKPA